MSIKKYSGTAFSEVSARKRFSGGSWNDLTLGKRFNGSAWIDLWNTSTISEPETETPAPTVTTYTKTYQLSSAQIYWSSGSQDNQSSSVTDLIVGSYGGNSSTNRRTLLFFPLSAIQSDLSGATVSKVELYLHRRNTSHGNSSSNAYIKYGTYSSAPSTWNGSDSGAADSGTPAFARGEAKWIILLNSVGTGMRDGSVKCLCLDSDTNYNLAAYGRYVRSDTALRITYEK
jgi:hypothetical protein